MSTVFDNTSHTNGSISVTSGNNLVFGTASFWTMTAATTIVTLAGSNTFRSSGQIYADLIAVSSTTGNNRVDILAAGIVSSSADNAILLGGSSNSVFNAGQVSGDLAAIAFSGSSNTVNNAGLLTAEANTIDFGSGASFDTVFNSGTIISHLDDAIQFDGAGAHVVDNSGTLLAPVSSAILLNASGSSITLTNSGTIAAANALSLGDGADVVVNSGTISGTVFLGSGDDLYDSSLGVTNGAVDAGSGDDTLLGGAGRDELRGSSGDDLLSGGDGDDLLRGGSGADEIDGGDGRDTADYGDAAALVVDLTNPENNTGVALGDSYVSIENILGGGGDDQLFGDKSRNVLRGGFGSDVLDGRAGADRLVGGVGDDQYNVDNSRDQVVERATEGADLVRATASFTLPVEVENLTLLGNGAINATGNAAINLIVGNNGANTLNGAAGSDSLTGGGAADIFAFDSALNPVTNVDTINDFLVGTDKVQLSRTIFTALNNGANLQANAFFVGGAASDANDRIIYNSTTGELFYDIDGTGAAVQVLFAQIGAGQALTAADFALVG